MGVMWSNLICLWGLIAMVMSCGIGVDLLVGSKRKQSGDYPLFTSFGSFICDNLD